VAVEDECVLGKSYLIHPPVAKGVKLTYISNAEHFSSNYKFPSSANCRFPHLHTLANFKLGEKQSQACTNKRHSSKARKLFANSHTQDQHSSSFPSTTATIKKLH
jgi:hypothetical protein